jgi:putative transposase
LYRALDVTDAGRRAAYLGLFESHLDDKTIDEIRQATQKGWALGEEGFKDEMERRIRRRSRPLARGGDHRSTAFRRRRIGFNRV